ncbi:MULTISPECIES: lipoprotein NlpI [Aliivibrio]|uniref:Lipoprotein NlpI n=1 Tax=Aliivibrio finisterrensis TaxID=511998 RepID=A0A4Q5KMM3_9GAMM|nr:MULTISPECIES: lipoprotein NlpI [Aliivibrio]MDD9175423.1 lipoprotein NlpI [Aliivibrio sp. S3TY1]MDD9177423.1 lipoprotein NlpI [Aliivibrio sp. A6]MDD9192502.1 lipoprotein NlpI [Aliivibrio sp. S2TY2]RYU46688.1 lipoprotein NlpI [Aliivibrio finisterrensis]RYU54133.1 lipoprotein NlpI [Aliivibrio finisterrensis]
MNWIRVALVGAVLVLSGCASNSSGWGYPPMAVPLQPSIQQEIQLSRLDQLLLRPDVDDITRAKMFYERGLINDSLGLRDLARVDFTQSLNLKPDQSDVFNILGVYYTQNTDFDGAYEALDSALELDPSNQFAERNLAIALYYGERYDQAYEIATKHYNDAPRDPYRAIWLYWIGLEVDAKVATETFQKQYQQRADEDFGWDLAGLILKETSEDEFYKKLLTTTRNNVALAEKLTEGYFYLAKRYQHEGDYSNAIALYKLAMAGNVYEYVEHRYSFVELGKIYQSLRELQEQKIKEQQALESKEDPVAESTEKEVLKEEALAE